MTQSSLQMALDQYTSFPINSENFTGTYLNLRSETISYLKSSQSLDFPLFLLFQDRLYEVIKAKELLGDQIEELLAISDEEGGKVTLCIERKDYYRYESVIDSIRNLKIKQLIEQNERLNQDTLNLFSELCRASQLIQHGLFDREQVSKIHKVTSELADSPIDSPHSLHTLCQMIKNDPTLYDHCASVGFMAGMFAKKSLAKPSPAIATLIRCGLYHDYGKIFISSDILHKPGMLTPEEFKIVKTHTTLGAEALAALASEQISIDDVVATVAREHHEKFSGHGYPDGKSGRLEEKEDGIHEYSRIILIIDIFNALLMKQDYRDAYEPARALQVMEDNAEHDFDPLLWSKFRQFVEEAITENENAVPYVQRSGRFSIEEILRKRQGNKAS